MKKNKGFTLVELLAVIVILGILVAIAIPVYINITRNAKQNEYNAKKKYIAEAAVRYAEENSTLASEFSTSENGVVSSYSNKTLLFTGAKLIGMGYLAADRYVDYNGGQIPLIENPIDEQDNLACHVVSLSVENYTYYAEVSDKDVNCDMSSQEVYDQRLGIREYEIENEKVVTNGVFSGLDNTFNWVRRDVAVIIDPEVDFETIKILKPDKNSVDVDKTKMFKGNANGKSIEELQKYTNVVIVRAKTVSVAEIDYTVEVKNSDGNNETKLVKTKVYIDKEPPRLLAKSFEGWVNKNKETLVYVNDNNGSGPAKVEYTDASGKKKTSNVDRATNTAKLTGLSNGVFKVIAIDRVGNRSEEYPITIKMVDDKPPVEETKDREWDLDSDISCKDKSNKSTYGKQCTDPKDKNCKCRAEGTDDRIVYDRSRTLKVTYRDSESGVDTLKYCITQNDGGCDPNVVVTNTSKTFDIKWHDSRDGEKVCYYAIDNVGNQSEKTCTDKYFVDGSKSYILSYNFDGERTTNISFQDLESGVYKYVVTATAQGDDTTHRCESDRKNFSEFYSTDLYSCLMPYLFANKTYNLTITLYNRSNTAAEITDKTINTSNYNMTTAYTFCDPNNNWCNGGQYYYSGVYVDYKDSDGKSNVFLLYKNANNSIFGVSTKLNQYYTLINQTCCDHNKCHAEYLNSNISGIWGSSDIEYKGYDPMSVKFNKFPANRIKVANEIRWAFDMIKSTSLQFLDDDEEETNVRSFDFIDIKSLADIGLAKGYIYHFPNFEKDENSGVTCKYKNKADNKEHNVTGRDVDGNKKSGVFNTSNLAAGSYYFKCTKPRTEESIDSEARRLYYEEIGLVYDDENPDFIITAEINEKYADKKASQVLSELRNTIDKTDIAEADNVILSETYNDDEADINEYPTYTAPVHSYIDDMATHNPNISYTAPFGILTYGDYAKLKTIPYFREIPGTDGQGIQTMLLAYVDKVVYKSYFDPSLLNRAYGHDGVYATISGLVGRGHGGGYTATTPMRFGRYNAAMVIPFNKNTHFSDGNGTPEHPFVVDNNWGI